MRRSGNFALKNLTKIPKEWGLYRPNPKTSRWLYFSASTAGGRPAGRPPTVENMTVGETRSTAQKQRAKLSGRSTDPVDRLWDLVDRSGRPPEPGRQQFGSEKLVKKIF